MADDDKVLTLDQIRGLTGHESNDAVRMALKRADVKSVGVTFSFEGGWPPKKIYEAADVWGVFGARLLTGAEGDPEAKAFCWRVFRKYIRAAAAGEAAWAVFSDELNE